MPDKTSVAEKIILHVGCGELRPNALPPEYEEPPWREVRLDISHSVRPDIVASMTDMSAVATGSVDAIWNSHALEHMQAHEVPVALKEFHRVLRSGGHVTLRTPDLQKIAELILSAGPTAAAYVSPAGPVTPLDMLYGHGALIARGRTDMQHKTAFTQDSLVQLLKAADFSNINALRNGFELLARAEK